MYVLKINIVGSNQRAHKHKNCPFMVVGPNLTRFCDDAGRGGSHSISSAFDNRTIIYFYCLSYVRKYIRELETFFKTATLAHFLKLSSLNPVTSIIYIIIVLILQLNIIAIDIAENMLCTI